jgi:ketosteroid isomerase-like protein
VQGRTAILEWVKAASITITNFTTAILEIHGRDGVAFSRGTYSRTFNVAGMSNAITDNGEYTIVWNKQSDGSWRVYWLIFKKSAMKPKPDSLIVTNIC